jgi:uncharacterized protein (DUF433 family)
MRKLPEKTESRAHIIGTVIADKGGRRNEIPRPTPLGTGIAFRLPAIMIPSMAATAYRYLINLPGVRSGNTIVEGTRIGVHDVIGLIASGATIDDVVRSFPDLSRAQVYECLAYYEDHRPEIDTLVARQMSNPGKS